MLYPQSLRIWVTGSKLEFSVSEFGVPSDALHEGRLKKGRMEGRQEGRLVSEFQEPLALPAWQDAGAASSRLWLSSPGPAEPMRVLAGSYFARDAAYSHHYSKSDSKRHMMFLARVLVGEFARGNTSFVRPPAKEGQCNVFYDSCVNSVSDPSIFVVFEKHQVYPEYVIQYTTSAKPVAGGSSLLSLTSFFGNRQ